MTKTKSLLAKFWKLVPSLIFVFAICAIFSDWTFATMDSGMMDGMDEATAASSLPWIKTELLGLISYIVKFIAWLTYLFSIFVGNLMDSSLIVDSGMGNTLHLIWTTMRNFVNVAFILVLLIIAVMVIFGGGGEKGLGMLKKVLPKFILALVLVNFTFFISRLVLTTNDVLTTAIMTIPETIAPEKEIYLPCEPGSGKKCGEKILEKAGIDSVTGLKKGIDDRIEYLATLEKHKMEGTVGKENITLVLTTYMLNLENLVKIKALGGNWDAFLGSIGAIVTATVVGLVIFMLFLALLVRMVVLWIVIALSPLAALAIVLGDVIPGLNTKGDFDLMSIFLKHAFMPAMISLPLVIGLVMIFANNAIGYNITLDTFFTFSGDSAADNLYSLLWWIASIIVIWYGTNTMIKKSSDIATKLTDGVHNGVNKFVGGAAKTLQYVPFLPTKNADGSAGKDVSIGALLQTPSRIQGKLAGQASSRAEQLSKGPAKYLGWEQKYRDDSSFKEAIRQAGGDKKKILEAIKTHFNQNGTDVTLSPDIIKLIRDSQITVDKDITKLSELVGNREFLNSSGASESEKNRVSKHNRTSSRRSRRTSNQVGSRVCRSCRKFY